jgi:glycosyltransferase involved in cell wall biosynthesis
MIISYAIPVCIEHLEIDKLLTQLTKFKRPEDEIIVQCDQGNTTQEVYSVLKKYEGQIKVIEFPLNNDFASFKNNLKQHCNGDWIYQIDADELLDEDFIQTIHLLLQENPTVDLFLVPRINTVDGLTQNHIAKWRWSTNEKGWINFPDYQTRILQNSPEINWNNKVHEVILGYKNYTLLPTDEIYCIKHHKSIEKQERQNNYYDTI